MKMKRFHLFYLTLVCVICLLPSLGMVFGASEPEATLPKLRADDGSLNPAVLEETEAYVAQGFALRPVLRTLWAQLNGAAFRTSVDERVILGEDGWLYGAVTAADYTGVTMEDEAMTYAVRNLYLMQEYAQNEGARLVFTIAPNKNSVYPEYMPGDYAAGTVSNALLLGEKLAEQNVGYVDLFTVFRQEEATLYYKTDSRWTARGAALAADSILQQMQISSGYFDGAFAAKTQQVGDLYEMLYPTGTGVESVDSYEGGFTYTVTEQDGDAAVTTVQGNARGRLVCWHDKFGGSLQPYLAEVYESAKFSQTLVYDLTEISRCEADVVIIELAECNLHRLVEYAPILPSPVRTVTAEAYGTQTLSGAEHSAGELTAATVTVPRTLVDSGSELYVKIGDRVYEGCVLWSEETLTCSVCVAEEIPKAMELIARKDGVYTAYSCVVSK